MKSTFKNYRMKTQRKPLIAVKFTRLSDDGISEFIRLADGLGWDVLDLNVCRWLVPTDPFPDGVIIEQDFNTDSSMVANYDQLRDTPTVVFRDRIDENDVVYESPLHRGVFRDRYAAGQMAVDYFAARGFNDILLLLQLDIKDANLAYRGVADRAKEIGVTLHIHYLKSDGGVYLNRQQKWLDETVEIISNLPKPLAFFAASDHIASKFSFDCLNHGVSVPEVISVLGLKNKEKMCVLSQPPLSSIDQNDSQTIRQCVTTLKQLMDGDRPPQEPVYVPPQGIITRRSTDILAVSDPRVGKAVRFMWDHLDWPITIDDVAYEAGVSRRTLSTIFRKCLGRSVMDELVRKRLERCCELLRTTDLKISQIGKQIGFPCQSYLQRTFAKTFGITPGKYRKQQGR